MHTQCAFLHKKCLLLFFTFILIVCFELNENKNDDTILSLAADEIRCHSINKLLINFSLTVFRSFCCCCCSFSCFKCSFKFNCLFWFWYWCCYRWWFSALRVHDVEVCRDLNFVGYPPASATLIANVTTMYANLTFWLCSCSRSSRLPSVNIFSHRNRARAR